MEQRVIFTIGHSKHPIETFLSLLEMHRIKILYDVRSLPYSRFSQYNRESLERALQNRQIQYIFDGTRLGGRISDPDCYLSRSIPTLKINIAELVHYAKLIQQDWFNKGIESLKESSADERMAILCSEEDPARCHRNLLVGRRLMEIGFQICHIRGDGRLEEAKFAEENLELTLGME
jgi:uncharacterized protein (DUF488 family)